MGNSVVLSIIVIAHNQKRELGRCVDSILAQPLPFPHEIIISDDASSDGTWELAIDYAEKHQEVQAYQCNTSDYNPANTSHRSGWNRCNGYKHTSGKYIAFVDGDDFFMEGTSVFNQQVSLLEKHPECACCMANGYMWKEGTDLQSAKLYRESFDTGEILPSETYIRTMFRVSHCFLYRRRIDEDPSLLYGCFFEDALLTAHYLQFGDIVCLHDAGHVYVQYPNSLWAKVIRSGDSLIYSHVLYIPYLIPIWKQVYLTEPYHLKKIWRTVRLLLSGHRLQKENLEWARQIDNYIQSAFRRRLSVLDYFHLLFLYLYIPLLVVIHPSAKWPYLFLQKFL